MGKTRLWATRLLLAVGALACQAQDSSFARSDDLVHMWIIIANRAGARELATVLAELGRLKQTVASAALTPTGTKREVLEQCATGMDNAGGATSDPSSRFYGL